MPVTVATYLLNEKRQSIVDIEKRHTVSVLVIPNPHLETPHFDVKRLRNDEVDEANSFTLIEKPDHTTTEVVLNKDKPSFEEPALKAYRHRQHQHQQLQLPAQPVAEAAGPSLLSRLGKWLASLFSSDSDEAEQKQQQQQQRRPNNNRRNNRGNNNRRRNNRSRSRDTDDEHKDAAAKPRKAKTISQLMPLKQMMVKPVMVKRA